MMALFLLDMQFFPLFRHFLAGVPDGHFLPIASLPSTKHTYRQERNCGYVVVYTVLQSLIFKLQKCIWANPKRNMDWLVVIHHEEQQR